MGGGNSAVAPRRGEYERVMDSLVRVVVQVFRWLEMSIVPRFFTRPGDE